MATSVYFNNQRATVEQQLLEDLIIESIKNHGIDVWYLPRESRSSTDELFGDDPVKCYRRAIKIEMYLESFQEYEGNQEFFGKFGLELQDNARLCMSRRSFERLITRQFPESHRLPKEGDLVYLPIQFKLMEIKFVQEEKNFFQLGRDSKNPYMYGLTMEAFKYNGELIQTGVTIIDNIPDFQAYSLNYQLDAGGSGTFIDQEWVYQGTDLENATAKAVISTWDKPSRILKLRNIKGSFVAGSLIKGSGSGALWYLTAAADVMRNANFENLEDNERIEQEADNVLDFSEANPFGEV